MAVTVGGTSITFNDGSVQTIAQPVRAWVTFNGSNGSIIASSGISSVVRQSTGYYTVTFSAAMPDANYVAMGSCTNPSGTGYFSISMQQSSTAAPTTSSCGIVTGVGTSAFDAGTVRVAFIR